MAGSDSSGGSARGGDEPSDDELADFLGLLNELKSTGCNLLVVGDAPRHLFTRASGRMLGDAEAVRYRVLATTDATAQSVADRLPDPAESPRPLTETTHVLTTRARFGRSPRRPARPPRRSWRASARRASPTPS